MSESANVRIVSHALRITFCALLLFLTGCGAQDEGQGAAVAVWLDVHALPSERVAAPEPLARRLRDRPVTALPAGDDTAALLAALHGALPDYVISWPGVAWDGVLADPWFREHYHFFDALSASDDGLTPLHIFGYTPSPFDVGAWQTVEQSFGGTGLELYAVRVNRQRLVPGELLYITLSWRGDLFAFPDAQRFVLRLLDVGGAGLRAQVEESLVNGLPLDLCRDGDAVTSRHILVLPEDLSYGDYVLAATLYRRSGQPAGGENLPLLTLSRPPDVTHERPAPESEGVWVLGEAVGLIGYDVPERVAPGDAFRVMLYWHARAAVLGDYTVFVHLLDANGAIAAQADGKPVWWTFPTTQWKPGQYIRDEHILELDAGLPRGDYRLAVGMYDAATGVRLTVTDAQGAPLPDGRIELRIVKVR